MPVLVRYCLSSVAPVFLLSTAVWLFVLNLLFYLREFLDYFFVYQAGVLNSLRLLFYIQPSFLVLVIPIGFLTALLVVYGRLSSDREAMALETCGFSVSLLVWPLILVSLLLSLVLVLFMDRLLPWGNGAFIRLQGRIVAERSAILIREKVFLKDFDGFVLYVDQKDDQKDILRGVTVFFTDGSKGPYRIIHAKEGLLRQDPANFHELLDLRDGILQQAGNDKPRLRDQFLQMHFRGCVLDLNARRSPLTPVDFRDARNISISELGERLKSERRSGVPNRYDELEYHKKFSLPFSSLAFALIGIPLGLWIRSGSIVGPLLAVVLVGVYDGFIIFGQNGGPMGLIPPLFAVWLPNLVLMAIGSVMILGLYHPFLLRSFLPGGGSSPMKKGTA